MSESSKIVLSLSLSGTLLFFILLVLKPLYKNKLSKRWQYYIWLIVIARMLIPFTPETTLVGSAFQYLENINVGTIQSAPPTNDVQSDFEVGDNYTTPNTEPQPTKSTIDTTPSLSIQTIITKVYENLWILWAAIAFALLIRKITMYQSFVRFVKAGRAEVSNIEILNLLADVGETIGVKKPVELFINPLISSPMLLGFFRPYIILPSVELEQTELVYIMRHELTHYKHLDMFYKWLVQLTVCLHWFNPFAYLLAKEINRCCELSCDEVIIRTLDKGEKKAYGDTLLNAMGAGGNYKDSLASVTLYESTKLLKERLDAIMKFKKTSKITVTIMLVLTLVLAVGATATGAYVAPIAASPKPPIGNTNPKADSENGQLIPATTPSNIPKTEYVKVSFTGVSVTGQGPVGVELARSQNSNVTFELLNMDKENTCTTDANIVNGIMQITVNNDVHNGLNVNFGPDYKNVVRIYIPDAIYTKFDIQAKEMSVNMQDFNAPVHVVSDRAGFRLIDTTISQGTYDIKSDAGSIYIEADTFLKDITANADRGNVTVCFSKTPTNLYLDTTNCGSMIERPDDWPAIYKIGSGTPKITLLSNRGKAVIALQKAETSTPNLSYEIDSSGKIEIPISTNSAEVIKPSDIDAFTMELIKTTNCWDTIENFLPYMTSTCVENVVATVRENLNVYLYPGYEDALTKAEKYFGKGTKTESDSPLTRGDIDEIAVHLVDDSANWSYVKPLFPHMTKGGIEQVVTIFLQRTGNYEMAKEAEVYMDKPINNISDKRGRYTDNTGGIGTAITNSD